MNVVVLSLCRTGVVQFEVRKVRSRVARQTIADFARGYFRPGGWGRRWFRKKYFQSFQLLGSKLEWLSVELELGHLLDVD